MKASSPITTIYTLGESILDEYQFQNILLEQSIETLVDIRSQPQSKNFPLFGEEQLRLLTEQCQCVYHWAGRQLGGTGNQQANSRHISLAREHQVFADYMDGEEFKQAANQLMSFASRTRLAILGEERNSPNCHQFMIADYLTLQGLEVQHIVSDSEIKAHVLSPSVRRESMDLIYDRQVDSDLN